MCSADDGLLDSLMMYDMREVCFTDRPMRGTRDYVVRVVLRLLAGDVQHKVYKFDFDRLSDEDEEEICAVCDAGLSSTSSSCGGERENLAVVPRLVPGPTPPRGLVGAEEGLTATPDDARVAAHQV